MGEQLALKLLNDEMMRGKDTIDTIGLRVGKVV
jgi:hypothetical protein